MKMIYFISLLVIFTTLQSCDTNHVEEKNNRGSFRNKTNFENNENSDTTFNRPENGEIQF